MSGWIFQKTEHKRTLGDRAPWQVGWYEEGHRRKRSCGPGAEGRALAEALLLRVNARLASGDREPVPSHDMRRDLLIATMEMDGQPLVPTGNGEKELVYFAEGVGLERIKIGVTVNVPLRISELDRASPVPIRLLATEPGGRAREADLHLEFARYRVRGEWFEAVEAIRRYVASIA